MYNFVIFSFFLPSIIDIILIIYEYYHIFYGSTDTHMLHFHIHVCNKQPRCAEMS